MMDQFVNRAAETAVVGTASGAMLPIFGMTEEQVSLDDIVTMLSYSNRFNGAAGDLSVMEHQLYCCGFAAALDAPVGVQRRMLFHDMEEFLFGDFIRPVKLAFLHDDAAYNVAAAHVNATVFNRVFGHEDAWDGVNTDYMDYIDKRVLRYEIEKFLPTWRMPVGLQDMSTEDMPFYERIHAGPDKVVRVWTRFISQCLRLGADPLALQFNEGQDGEDT